MYEDAPTAPSRTFRYRASAAHFGECRPAYDARAAVSRTRTPTIRSSVRKFRPGISGSTSRMTRRNVGTRARGSAPARTTTCMRLNGACAKAVNASGSGVRWPSIAPRRRPRPRSFGVLVVPGFGQPHLEHERALGPEARLRRHHRDEAAQQQTGARDEHDREGELRDDQSHAHARVGPCGGAAPAALAHYTRRRDARRAHRGHQARQQRGEQRHGDAEHQNGSVGSDRLGPRQPHKEKKPPSR